MIKNTTQLEILTSLLEINNDRIIIYSLVKNEIIYKDLKTILGSCIERSLLFKAQLTEEINSIISIETYKTVPSQNFLNVWLVINDCLSKHEHEMISSLFTASENIFETTYINALNKKNLKYLSSRHRILIYKQRRLLNAS